MSGRGDLGKARFSHTRREFKMAQSNIYLKLDGLNGESLDDDHKQWIEVQNWSWGVDNPASFAVGQGGQATQAHIAAVNIQKSCDAASVALFKASTTGKHIPKATLSCMKLDGDTRVEYLKIDFTDLMISSLQWSGSGNEHMVHEHVPLVFAEFKPSYVLQKARCSRIRAAAAAL
jgi:type VI secretion system secreted protein Hcp